MRYPSASSRHLLRAIVLIPILAAALSGCFYRAAVPYKPKIIGTVTAASGMPSVIRHNEQFILGVQSQIYEGDILETNGDSRTRIKMIDHSIIRLGHRAHLVIHRYDFSPGASSSSARMTFTSGAMQIDAEDLAKSRTPNFHIQTPLANIHARSTGFWAGFKPGGKQLDLLLLHGEDIEVTNDQGSVKLDNRDFGTTVIAGGTPQVPVEWTAQKRSRAINATTI